ncbi:MAG: DNA-binding protein [Myxococcaceae bacterium]|nr:MAG: DNA-binding protein [Myxococcaceae bacterium]
MSEPTSHAQNAAPDFLTVDEAAALLRVNRKTLYEAIRLGQVPGVVRLGRVLRIQRIVMVDWSRGNSGPALGVNP